MLPCGCNEQCVDEELDEFLSQLSEPSDEESYEEEEEEEVADDDVYFNAIDEDDVNDNGGNDGNAEQINTNTNNNDDDDDNDDDDIESNDENADALSSESDDTSDDTDDEEEETPRFSLNWMGSSQMRARLGRELAELRRNPIQSCVANPVNSNIFEWVVSFRGPSGTPYEGGIFEIKISFKNGYPSGPPTLKFITKIYHCNVHMDTVCVDQWTSNMTASELLQWLITTMTTPNLQDPMNPAIVKLYTTHRSEHDKIAREWTQHFAMK